MGSLRSLILPQRESLALSTSDSTVMGLCDLEQGHEARSRTWGGSEETACNAKLVGAHELTLMVFKHNAD